MTGRKGSFISGYLIIYYRRCAGENDSEITTIMSAIGSRDQKSHLLCSDPFMFQTGQKQLPTPITKSLRKPRSHNRNHFEVVLSCARPLLS